MVLNFLQSVKIFESNFRFNFLLKTILIGELSIKLVILHFKMQLSIFTVLDPTKIASTSDLNMSEYVSDIELVIFVLLFFSKVI